MHSEYNQVDNRNKLHCEEGPLYVTNRMVAAKTKCLACDQEKELLVNISQIGVIRPPRGTKV